MQARSIISQKGFPFLCCQLSILNFLDALCYEKDHRPDNYNIEYVGENPVIHVFDNDSSLAFFLPFLLSFHVFKILLRWLIMMDLLIGHIWIKNLERLF